MKRKRPDFVSLFHSPLPRPGKLVFSPLSDHPVSGELTSFPSPPTCRCSPPPALPGSLPLHPQTQWEAHLVRPRHQERSHLTKFSPSPIFSPLLFSIVSMNDRQNASITHSAHYSVRHHWHNAKQYQAEYRWRAEFRYGWTELLPLPTMELTSFSSFLLTWKYLEVEEPGLGPGHDEGNHDDEVTYQVVILLGKLKRKL